MSFIDITMEIVTEPYNRRYREQINTFSLYEPSLQDAWKTSWTIPENQPLYSVLGSQLDFQNKQLDDTWFNNLNELW